MDFSHEVCAKEENGAILGSGLAKIFNQRSDVSIAASGVNRPIHTSKSKKSKQNSISIYKKP